MRPRVAFALLFLTVFAARLTHSSIVWVEEGYPAAAALQVLSGRTLYRDIWFDKPPLSPYFYALFGAAAGWPLRLAGALFVTLCCWLLYRLGVTLWGRREGLVAAGLLGFYLTFDIPSAVMALAPDMLMIAPHIAALWLAALRRPAWSGLAAGVAFLTNSKGAFVLAACLAWNPSAAFWTLAGFAFPVALHLALLDAQGALTSYWLQVWDWGFTYSRNSFVGNPLRAGLLRTLSWAGFHLTVLGAALVGRTPGSARSALAPPPLLTWFLISLVAVAAGWRFFPRYYFQLLPVVVLAGARGLCILPRKYTVALLLLLLIPAARFGPRYIQLATGDTTWRDLAMSNDSRQASEILKSKANPTDTLLVWGYRPDIYALTRLPAGTRFLDSQALTGVLADRHLTNSDVLYPFLAAHNRGELVTTQPRFIVDGLGPYNPKLAVAAYEDLKPWLDQYEEFARTSGCILYRRKAIAPSSTEPASPGTR